MKTKQKTNLSSLEIKRKLEENMSGNLYNSLYNKGITLIALVVTIVVLLILAGVSINLVIGNNGIITKATETSVAQAHAQVRDAIMLAYGEYQVNMYTSKNINTSKEIKIAATTGVATGTSQQTFLEFLQDKGYTDENGIVNVENLLGTKLKLGNGSNDKDVYKVEEGEGSYVLNYYEKDGTTTKLDTIAPISTESSKITYTQADIDETLKYFTFNEKTGVLAANKDMIGDYKNKVYPTKVVIPKEINGVKVTELWENLYYNGMFSYSNIEEIVILAEINSIETNSYVGAFENCQNLKRVELPNSVTSIGERAFYNCTNLSSIELPNSVTSIGERAFYNCTNLSSIELPNSLTTIEQELFIHCTSLTSITIPSSVTSIGSGAFYVCTGLTNITIPSSVTSIGDCAFSACTGLTNITIPSSVTSIENGEFRGCTSLTSIIVEEGNTVYDSRNGCNAIIEKSSNTLIAGCKTTIIPDSVTSIGSGAFYGCTGLTSITIPSSVTSIENGEFRGCTGLTNIIVEEGNTVYDSRNDCNAIIEKSSNTLIAGCKTTIIPDSVTSIGSDAFDGCTGLTSITIPSSVTSIGDWAFYNCTSLQNVYYTGTEEQWNAITIGSSNDPLTNATKTYNYVEE